MSPVTEPLEGSNFVVDLGTGASTSFDRVEIPAAMLDEVTFRSGGEKTTDARKQPGLATYGRLVLHRSLTTDLTLWSWWMQAHTGDKGVDRDVRVSLLDAQMAPVCRWTFRNAFPVVHRVSALDAGSSAAVVETLEVAFDSMSLE